MSPADPTASAAVPSHRDATLPQLLDLLERWTGHGWLRELDLAFARFLAGQAPDAPALLVLAAALASHQLGRGHVCLDLAATLADPSFVLSLPPDDAWREPAERPPLPGWFLAGLDLAGWQAALRHPLLVGEGPGATPLVRVGPRLYLRRFWQCERDLRAAIEQRLRPWPAPPEARLRAALDALFPPDAEPGRGVAGVADGGAARPRPHWQKLACALAARQGFCIITGGPGTGKTTTVVKLLALLQSLALQAGGRPLRIRLAAPTGKAAARLNGSIASALQSLPLHRLPEAEAVRAAIPATVSTLHRLLGSRPDSRRFRHDAQHPLPLDLLVVDEASMVDLEMAAALFAALPPTARLVWLGDKDQLASVEAGAVLGELCARAAEAHYTPATRDWLQAVCGEAVPDEHVDPHGQPLDQAVAMLRHSHRFGVDSGIGRLAEAVNTGRLRAARALWAQPPADLQRVADLARDDQAWRRLVIDGGAASPGPGGPVGYRQYLQVLHDQRPPAAAPPAAFDAWAFAVLTAQARFQVLCTLREGPWGVEGLNQRIGALLHAEGWLAAPQGWTLGRPVLVTRNDHGLGLMNGDVGVTLALPDPGGPTAPAHWRLRVAFPATLDPTADPTGRTVRWVLPSRLQAVDTVFAMTVHKSQGSEFEHAALVLPPALNPLLTRELVYTGLTRARRWFTLAHAAPDPQVFEAALQRRVQRASGLFSG